MTQTSTERLHIIEGSPWMDAVISLLDSRWPYRPWRYGFGEAQIGDPVAIVLDTDPPSVMTELATIGADGRPDLALMRWPHTTPGLIDLATLAIVCNFSEDPRNTWVLRGGAAAQMESALTECGYRLDESMRLGRSEIAAARILLHSVGECLGCRDAFDFTTEDARDAVYIHMVDTPQRQTALPVVRTERYASYLYDSTPESWLLPEIPADIPGVLCRRCEQSMREEGFTSLLDFRFARHPKCPRCRANRTRKAMYGEPSGPIREPWLDPRGCVQRGEHVWTCGACGLEWW
ncbi:hypothetical protein [Mycolicibacterium rhodesiae]|nr:hypothetical protein [Mycolicibacterium rhodesiae]